MGAYRSVRHKRRSLPPVVEAHDSRFGVVSQSNKLQPERTAIGAGSITDDPTSRATDRVRHSEFRIDDYPITFPQPFHSPDPHSPTTDIDQVSVDRAHRLSIRTPIIPDQKSDRFLRFPTVERPPLPALAPSAHPRWGHTPVSAPHRLPHEGDERREKQRRQEPHRGRTT